MNICPNCGRTATGRIDALDRHHYDCVRCGYVVRDGDNVVVARGGDMFVVPVKFLPNYEARSQSMARRTCYLTIGFVFTCFAYIATGAWSMEAVDAVAAIAISSILVSIVSVGATVWSIVKEVLNER